MVLAIHNAHPTWISVKFVFAFKLRWNFIVRLVECTYKLGHLGCVISFSIVGTADNNSDEEPVFSLTIYASFGRSDEISWSDNFKTFLLALKDLGLKNQFIELRSDISGFAWPCEEYDITKTSL